MDGIIVCKKCNATIIVGEQKKRKHTDPYMIEGDVLWVRRYDGKWYKHDLPSTHSSATTNAEQPRWNNQIPNTTNEKAKVKIKTGLTVSTNSGARE